MTKVVDPLGGSYYVEALTQELVDKAWEIIERVEKEGGMAKAVAAGWPKAMIETAAAARQARVDRGDDVIVGVNKYRRQDEDLLETLEVDNTKVRERSEEHTSELQSLMRISYAVFCLKKKKQKRHHKEQPNTR